MLRLSETASWQEYFCCRAPKFACAAGVRLRGGRPKLSSKKPPRPQGSKNIIAKTKPFPLTGRRTGLHYAPRHTPRAGAPPYCVHFLTRSPKRKKTSPHATAHASNLKNIQPVRYPRPLRGMRPQLHGTAAASGQCHSRYSRCRICIRVCGVYIMRCQTGHCRACIGRCRIYFRRKPLPAGFGQITAQFGVQHPQHTAKTAAKRPAFIQAGQQRTKKIQVFVPAIPMAWRVVGHNRRYQPCALHMRAPEKSRKRRKDCKPLPPFFRWHQPVHGGILPQTVQTGGTKNHH